MSELPADADLFSDEPLQCPHCGENYLYHIGVTLFERREDDDSTVVVETIDGFTAISAAASKDCNNPSPRRHGLVITFECEHCTAKPQLAFAQHKGQTFRAWRHKSAPARSLISIVEAAE